MNNVGGILPSLRKNNLMSVIITECPRDAMQGIKDWIPTATKTNYLNSLLQVGFDVLDFGSFVSPKAIPQLKDTAEVLKGLKLEDTSTKLLSIVANKRGAVDACSFDEISFLGYPFSISEEFQKRNSNKTIDQSLVDVEEVFNLAEKSHKELVVYISMAFGNPYGEIWHPDLVNQWCSELSSKIGVTRLALSDTIGVSNPENIGSLFTEMTQELPNSKLGVHLHTTKETAHEKIEAAIHAGCTRFDGAIKGYGGCPMAADDLVGNMPTESLTAYLDDHQIEHGLDSELFSKSMLESSTVFDFYH